MNDSNSPIFILAIVKRIYGKIPSIIGDEQWSSIQKEVDELIQKIEFSASSIDRYLPTAQLLRVLSNYEALLIQINVELKIINILYDKIKEANVLKDVDQDLVQTSLGSFYSVTDWNFDHSTLLVERTPNEQIQLELRGIKLAQGGVDGAKSIKLKNFQFDNAKLLTLLGAFSTLGHTIIDSQKAVFIAASLLTVIGTLLNTLTVQITEQDASVFWALIIGSNQRKNKPINTSTILKITNKERKKHWLEPLDLRQLSKSLEKLRSLGAVKQGTTKSWMIIESFAIRD